jgi:hypothetical protein
VKRSQIRSSEQNHQRSIHRNTAARSMARENPDGKNPEQKFSAQVAAFISCCLLNTRCKISTAFDVILSRFPTLRLIAVEHWEFGWCLDERLPETMAWGCDVG